MAGFAIAADDCAAGPQQAHPARARIKAPACDQDDVVRLAPQGGMDEIAQTCRQNPWPLVPVQHRDILRDMRSAADGDIDQAPLQPAAQNHCEPCMASVSQLCSARTRNPRWSLKLAA